MDEEREHYSWKDSQIVKHALKLRPPNEVYLVDCDECGRQTYYNEGSQCFCEWCEADLTDLLFSEDEDGNCEDLGNVYTVEDAIDAEVQAEIDGFP